MSGKRVSSIRTTRPVTLFRYAPDGNKALYIDHSGRAITVVELDRGEPISTLRDHRHVFLDAVYLPDSRRILSANNHGRLQLWDIHTRRMLLNIAARGQAYFNKVAVSSDGHFAASLSKDNSILLWDLRNGKLVKEFSGHSDDINHISFIDNNKKLLSGGHDNMVRIWKLP